MEWWYHRNHVRSPGHTHSIIHHDTLQPQPDTVQQFPPLLLVALRSSHSRHKRQIYARGVRAHSLGWQDPLVEENDRLRAYSGFDVREECAHAGVGMVVQYAAGEVYFSA